MRSTAASISGRDMAERVRELGGDGPVVLGLPTGRVYRHRFPGPGLGVRIRGEVKKAYADLLRRADATFIRGAPQGGPVRQDLAGLCGLPAGEVGGRDRRWPTLRLRGRTACVETIDFMTARWAHLPYDFLDHVSRRTINKIPGISRVTYDTSGKPPATIEWE